MSEDKKLTAEQLRAVMALLTCKSVTEAAAMAGVSERTISRWQQEPAFKAELNDATAQAMAHATRRLTASMNEAASVIHEVLTSPREKRSVRLRAALGLVAVLPSLRAMTDLEARVQGLEAAQGVAK